MFCKKCGARLGDDAAFCSSCGEKVVQDNLNNEEESPKQTVGVVCKQCGSGDTTKIDGYTYKCNMCGTIISLPRPDTKITNINSFTNSVDDVPVYQVEPNMSKDEFIRKCVMKLAKDEKINADFIKGLIIHNEDVVTAYITFAEVKYTTLINYSCNIRMVENHYVNGENHSNYRYTPMMSSASDSGIDLVGTCGSETKLNFVRPIYGVDSSNKYVPYVEQDKFPLKKRIDRSVEEKFSIKKVEELAIKSKDNLPSRGQVEDWKYNGQSRIDKIDTLHYVPCYNVTTSSNDRKILFAATALNNSGIYPQYLFEKTLIAVNESDKPSESNALKQYKKRKALSLLALFSTIFGFVFAGVSFMLFPMFGFLCLIGVPFGVAAGIAGNVVRKKSFAIINSNLKVEYKINRLEACEQCLSNNNLPELSEEERNYFVQPGLVKKPLKEKAKVITLGVLLGLSAITAITFCAYSIAAKKTLIPRTNENYSVVVNNQRWSC